MQAKFGTKYCAPYLTLMASESCSFGHRLCVGSQHGYVPKPGHVWLNALNRFTDIEYFLFNGGEPARHPDFIEIMNGLRDVAGKITVSTACSAQTFEKLCQVKPRENLHIRIICAKKPGHREGLFAQMLRLQGQHMDNIQLVFVSTFSRLPYPEIEKFINAGIRVIAEPLSTHRTGYLNTTTFSGGSRNSHGCTRCCSMTEFRPIAPNGDVYPCHQLMFTRNRSLRIGNIFDRAADTLDLPADACAFGNWCVPRPAKQDMILVDPTSREFMNSTLSSLRHYGSVLQM